MTKPERNNDNLSYKKSWKVLSATALSLSLLLGIAPSGSAKSFDGTAEQVEIDLCQNTLLTTQKETKGFTAKQRVAYYNKFIDKIVKDGKKQSNEKLQILNIFMAIKLKLTYSTTKLGMDTPYTKYKHKDLGVYAVNSGVADAKGYNKVFQDAMKKAGFNAYLVKDSKWLEWSLVKIGKHYYHFDVYSSDKFDGLGMAVFAFKNDWEMADLNRNFKADKKRPAKDEKAEGFASLHFHSIIKKTKKEYYHLELFDVVKTSFTGERESIYTLNDREFFIAKKGTVLYYATNPEKVGDTMEIFSTNLNSLQNKKKIGETYESGWGIRNGKLTFHNKKTDITNTIKVDKDTSFIDM